MPPKDIAALWDNFHQENKMLKRVNLTLYGASPGQDPVAAFSVKEGKKNVG